MPSTGGVCEHCAGRLPPAPAFREYHSPFSQESVFALQPDPYTHFVPVARLHGVTGPGAVDGHPGGFTTPPSAPPATVELDDAPDPQATLTATAATTDAAKRFRDTFMSSSLSVAIYRDRTR